jgi:AraC-like DNA-binding protein
MKDLINIKNYQYREYAPSPALHEYVKCYWTFQGPPVSSEFHQRIMPNGSCELTVHFGDLYKNLSKQKAFIEPRIALFGPSLSASSIQCLGKSQLASIRFTPNGFFRLFDIPVKHFTDSFLDTDCFKEVFKHVSPDQLLDSSFKNIANAFEKFLMAQLKRVKRVPFRIELAVQHIQQVGGVIEINKLPDMLNLSKRNFELQFLQQVGFSAKRYAEIVRFNQILGSLYAGKNSSLTELALKHHYYDQSHFIHSFRKITGLTPGEFLTRHKGGFFFK